MLAANAPYCKAATRRREAFCCACGWRADEKLSAFLELERQVLTVTFYLESVHADSIRRRGVPYPG